MKRLLTILISFSLGQLLAQDAEKVYEKVNDAVVRIYTYHNDNTSHGQGSGVIIKDKGWVITNYHNLGDAEIIRAEHKGQHITLDSIIAMDADKDVLILQLNKDFLNKYSSTIPSLKLGDSKKLKVGQKIYAIGSPYGFENTMTEGIISGLRTSFDSTKNFIQISAPISSGSSGGAIVNSKCELIGISTMVISGGTAQNLNFALQIDEVIKTSKGGKKMNAVSKEEYANFYFQSGQKELYQKNYLSAIINFEKAIKYLDHDESAAILYYYTGLAFHKLKRLDSAAFYYNKSLHIKKIGDTYVGIGTISLDNGDYDSAIKFFEFALQLNSEFSEALVAMGNAYYLKKDNLTALKYLQKAVTVSPNNPKANYLLGNISMEIKKYDLAVMVYSQAIKYNPYYADAFFGLSIAYQNLGDMVKSEQCKKRALELNPDIGK